MNKLTIEQAERLSQEFSSDETKAHYKQLADTMRELEAMRQTNERNVETASEQLKQMRLENERLLAIVDEAWKFYNAEIDDVPLLIANKDPRND